ncbi:MAG: NigD-like protein [Bacteroides sp.]|nr:NigD-like protein [Bacteroides sp.]
MKKFNLLLVGLLMALVALPVLQSCNDDDGYSIGDIGETIGTIRVTGNSYYILSDAGNTILPITNDPYGYQPVDGQRVTATFNPLYDDYKVGDKVYDLAVKFYRIYNILTKQIEDLTEENKDEIGDDPVRLIKNRVWIGGGYLNVNFIYNVPARQAHRVSLVRNTLAEPENDDYIHLEYRYNTYGDETSYERTGLVSFNLNSLEDELKAGAKGIKLRFTSATTGEQELTFDITTVDQESDLGVDMDDLEENSNDLE